MDSKKYADKVIGFHDFSLKYYPNGSIIFLEDGVNLFILDTLSITKEGLKENTNNFIFSIIGRFCEHFIDNLCVKKEDFWYVWDTVVSELNNDMLEQFISFNPPNRYYNEQRYEPDFLLPNSHEFIRNLNIGFGNDRYRITSRELSVVYMEYNFTNKTNTFKEFRIPIPNLRRYPPIDRNISFHW